MEIELKRLVSLGNYTMKTLMTRGAKGPFNITMIGVVAEGKNLEIIAHCITKEVTRRA